MTWQRALSDAWSLLVPVECAGCDEPDRALCPACALQLDPVPAPRSAAGLEVVTALRYEGAVRRVILALKEEGRTDVAAALCRPLAAAIDRATPPGAEIVAVPASRASYRRRGFDPVPLLLERAGVRHARVLMPARSTAQQKALGIEDRRANLRGAFVARTPLAGRRFVVVDDVLTTGATLTEAARAIRAAGGTVVAGAALAFTPRLLATRDNAPAEDYRGATGRAR